MSNVSKRKFGATQHRSLRGAPSRRNLHEAEMTDAEKKERERLVKGMKKSADDFEKRYPGRGEDVMYATATKMATEESPMTQKNPTGFYVMGKTQSVGWYKDQAEAEKVAKQMNYRGGTIYTVVPDMGKKPGMTEAMASKTFTVIAFLLKPSAKVLEQLRVSQDEIMIAAKDLRRKFPNATISVENKGGKIVKVFKPGEMIKETRLSVTENTIGLPKAWLLKAYAENEKNKNHVGNALFLTRLFGTPQEILFVDKLADIREKEGFIDPRKYKNIILKLDDLHDRYYAALKALDESHEDSHEDSEYGTYYGNEDEMDEYDDDMGFEVVFDDDEVAEDDDQSMMLAQLDAIRHRAGALHQALSQIEIEDVPAWIQDKVSVADHSMNAILDYFMFETKTLREAEEKAAGNREIAWFLQPAHLVAKMLGGSGYSPVGTKAEDIVNNAIIAFLRGSHTTESWKMAGAALNSVRDVAGVEWNTSLIKPEIAKAMGIKEPSQKTEPEPEPEPEPEKTPEPEPKKEPKPEPEKTPAPAEKEVPAEEPTDEPEAAKKSDKKEPDAANESMEIEIKVGKPMKNVTFQQAKDAALEFAGAVCPGMKPNGVTPEQIVNNAVSVWFYRHPVPLEADLKTLGKALAIIDTLGIEWNPHLVPAPYLSALALPTVKVTTLTDDGTTKVDKKIDSLENILLEL